MKKTKIQPSDNFTAGCDIGQEKQRSQLFTAEKSGILKSFTITTLKSGYPNQDFKIDFYESELGKIKGNKALVFELRITAYCFPFLRLIIGFTI